LTEEVSDPTPQDIGVQAAHERLLGLSWEGVAIPGNPPQDALEVLAKWVLAPKLTPQGILDVLGNPLPTPEHLHEAGLEELLGSAFRAGLVQELLDTTRGLALEWGTGHPGLAKDGLDPAPWCTGGCLA